MASEARETMSLDYWRCVFRCTSVSVFEILENAIRLAAADCPDELAARRDGIAESLFTCRPRLQHSRSSSGATTAATTTAAAPPTVDGTDAAADVPGTPGASFFREEIDVGGNLAAGDSAAADSEIRGELDAGDQKIRREGPCVKRKREDAANESPEPANVASEPEHSQNGGQSEALKAGTRQHDDDDDKSLAEKLEASRARLRDGYEAAKKTRLVRVIELHQIPKPSKARKDSIKNRCRRAVSVRSRR